MSFRKGDRVTNSRQWHGVIQAVKEAVTITRQYPKQGLTKKYKGDRIFFVKWREREQNADKAIAKHPTIAHREHQLIKL